MADRQQLVHRSECALDEDAGYFQVPGAHLYTVLHSADKPADPSLLQDQEPHLVEMNPVTLDAQVSA